jgi:Ca2+-binding EF-hand superfamily protein
MGTELEAELEAEMEAVLPGSIALPTVAVLPDATAPAAAAERTPNRPVRAGTALFRSVDIKTNGPQAEMRTLFRQLDTDNSGTLDKAEMEQLIRQLSKKKLSDKHVNAVFQSVCAHDNSVGGSDGSCSFGQFARWHTEAKETQRREFRTTVKDAFTAVDTDRSGWLSKEEFAKLASKCKGELQMNPPFDLESDWELCALPPSRLPCRKLGQRKCASKANVRKVPWMGTALYLRYLRGPALTRCCRCCCSLPPPALQNRQKTRGRALEPG